MRKQQVKGRRRPTPPDSPERARLRVLLKQNASIQRKIREAVQRGTRSNDEQEQERQAARARLLAWQLANGTWEAIHLHLVLAVELPGPSTCYYAPGVQQWARVRALSSGRFLFEALTHEGEGVLAEVESFELLADWQPSTVENYTRQLDTLLDGPGVQWNALKPTQ